MLCYPVCNHILLLASYRWQKLLPGKNCSQSSLRDHNTQAKKLQKLTRSAHRSPPIPMASLDPMPSSFGGRPRNSRATSIYPSLTLLSKRTARFSLFLMNKREVLHRRGFFAVPIVALPFNPFGGRDSHDSSAGRFAGRAHLNGFFVTRKKFEHCSI
jgi:hypothetical protein